MIAKHVPMKTLRKSNFGDLVRYLTDAKGLQERVGDVRLTNCHADELDDALLEIMATQALNTRALGDKTYHLIASFRVGEQPSKEVLAEIEQRLCVGLGFDEHQRISAVHHDTDNLHVHVAINKIHPTRLTIHEPYLAYRTLAEQCATLELEHNLEHDNHERRRRGAENRAADMENAAGLESLIGWIKREHLPALLNAPSWRELHQVLDEHGLNLRERGNGFVINAQNGITAKASSVSRELSKSKLQARLGPYQPSQERAAPTNSGREYQSRPMRSHVDTSELYAQYKAEQQQRHDARMAAMKQARHRKLNDIETAKRDGRARRTAIKLLGGGPVSKRALYAMASRSLRDRIEKIGKHYMEQRRAIEKRHRRHSWHEWLQHQAKAGNHQALTALRARPATQQLTGNVVTGPLQEHTPSVLTKPDHVTTTGTLLYRVGDCSVRDDGERLQLSHDATLETLQRTLELATRRYGKTLSVNGSEEFKEQVARAAVVGRLDIRFDDPTLEQQRRVLAATKRVGMSAAKRSRGSHRF